MHLQIVASDALFGGNATCILGHQYMYIVSVKCLYLQEDLDALKRASKDTKETNRTCRRAVTDATVCYPVCMVKRWLNSKGIVGYIGRRMPNSDPFHISVYIWNYYFNICSIYRHNDQLCCANLTTP